MPKETKAANKNKCHVTYANEYKWLNIKGSQIAQSYWEVLGKMKSKKVVYSGSINLRCKVLLFWVGKNITGQVKFH